MNTKQIVQDFFADFTLETTPGAAKKIDDYGQYIRQGEKVYVTFLPGSDFADTVAVSKRLKAEGLEPIPHIAARSTPNRQFLETGIKQCVEEAGVERFLVIGGAVDKPVGEFDCTAQILETGLFDKYGIKSVGLAGHPEGSPDITDEGIREALRFKNAFAERTDADLYLVTQFCFEAAPIIAWDKALQAEGNRLPIHIGLPGLATLKSLIGHSKACGVGASMKFLTKQAKNVSKLLLVNAPDELTIDLATYKATDPNCGIAGLHIYPLGGLPKTANWSYAVRDGRFNLHSDGRGFDIV
ncbi:methylenetetrahydrofolate reductase [Ostreibacterium oceani]|uniref:MetFprotein n=1 Tax=Ostreibacterium oceani TaxID=2654998 RepID=A0A6N7EXF7_9GAMM|nr:metFprotein [Ostreibacterium oceani]MPV86230.1 metFprotein [Ostreibacterium oceani]